MADDSETDDENVVVEANARPADAESGDDDKREIRLIEDQQGFWTVVDAEKGPLGDAPTKAAGYQLLETILEEMDEVTIPDVEPEVPEEEDGPLPFPPGQPPAEGGQPPAPGEGGQPPADDDG